MEVYLLRHGRAQQHSSTGRDADRELTPDGAHLLRAVLAQARKMGAQPAAILTSPYVRARQTAAIAVEILDFREAPVSCPSLTPDSSVSALWNEVRDLEQYGSILLASHEPLISAAANWMVRGPERLRFEPGSIARIDFANVTAEPRGILKWMLP